MSLHTSYRTTLLHQLDSLYSWLIASVSPNAPTERGPLGRARTLLSRAWDELLPFEREEAVDILLGAYCKSRLAPVNVDELNYASIAGDIGYVMSRRRPTGDGKHAHSAISTTALTIGHLYAAYPHGTANAAAAWCQRLLDPKAGLTAVKLDRMEPGIRDDVVERLDRLEEELMPRSGSSRPLLDPNLLPSAESLLAAELAHQLPEDRFHLVGELLSHLHELYDPYSSSAATAPPGARDLVLEYAQLGAVLAAHAEGEDALARFEALHAEKQRGAVVEVRRVLFVACEALQGGGALPGVRMLTRSLVGLLLHA
ncbi:hypothetical protein JCM10450v2_006513 [Rhodotorula kratochvilovae]